MVLKAFKADNNKIVKGNSGSKADKTFKNLSKSKKAQKSSKNHQIQRPDIWNNLNF